MPESLPKAGSNVLYVEVADLAGAAYQATAAEQAVLDAVNQRVAAAADLAGVMNFLFDQTRALFPCDRISLAFLDETGRRLVSRWSRTDYQPERLRVGYAEALAGSSLQAVLESRQFRIISDLEAYGRAHPQSVSTRLLVLEGVRSSLTCPLTVDDRVVGVLFRSARRSGAYGLRELWLHAALAERLAQAVEKTWRLDQLAAANRAYTEMLGFVSHELKGPLAGIITDAEVLTGGYLGALEPAQREKIGKLAERARFLLGLVQEYLDLARGEGAGLRAAIQRQLPFWTAALEPVLRVLEPQLQTARCRVRQEGPADLAVDADPGLLRIILMNLVGNAIKYGNPGGEIRVAAGCMDGRFRLAVRNAGPGFAPEDKERLFKRFSRLPAPELRARPGTGIGLFTVLRAVQAHGGRVQAESQPGAWAEFAIEFPQPLGE